MNRKNPDYGPALLATVLLQRPALGMQGIADAAAIPRHRLYRIAQHRSPATVTDQLLLEALLDSETVASLHAQWDTVRTTPTYWDTHMRHTP